MPGSASSRPRPSRPATSATWLYGDGVRIPSFEARLERERRETSDKGFHGVAVLQVVASEHNQHGEDEEARAEDDQAGVEADGEVGSK